MTWISHAQKKRVLNQEKEQFLLFIQSVFLIIQIRIKQTYPLTFYAGFGSSTIYCMVIYWHIWRMMISSQHQHFFSLTKNTSTVFLGIIQKTRSNILAFPHFFIKYHLMKKKEINNFGCKTSKSKWLILKLDFFFASWICLLGHFFFGQSNNVTMALWHSVIIVSLTNPSNDWLEKWRQISMMRDFVMNKW